MNKMEAIGEKPGLKVVRAISITLSSLLMLISLIPVHEQQPRGIVFFLLIAPITVILGCSVLKRHPIGIWLFTVGAVFLVSYSLYFAYQISHPYRPPDVVEMRVPSFTDVLLRSPIVIVILFYSLALIYVWYTSLKARRRNKDSLEHR